MKKIKETKIGLHISNDSTGQNEFSEKMKRCQGRRNGAESNTGATNWNSKENPKVTRAIAHTCVADFLSGLQFCGVV